MAESTPTWGLPDHPFYNVRPVLHEPGPINMSAFGDTTGLPVHAGETLRLNSIYDDTQPHVRVMGIMIVYFAPESRVTQNCGSIPNWTVQKTNEPGRAGPIPFTIPLTGLDANGQATTINAPRAAAEGGLGHGDPGGRPLLRRPQPAGEERFQPHLAIRRTGASQPDARQRPAGDRLRQSRRQPHLTQKFKRPGTYRFFCALHPVQMQERIVVTGKKKKHKKKHREH